MLRAYIAASRRSDRSLEARIESARRASEIHKKRTGRALRVTEEDVVNEEMYEEEDDDLPSQYRRLMAHITATPNAFNRRFHAYLAAQHATRDALVPFFSNPYMQQYSNPATFSPGPNSSSFPSTYVLPPQMLHQPQQISYAQSPYPMPNDQSYRPQLHQRAASISTPAEISGYQAQPQDPKQSELSSVGDQRRMSMPPQHIGSPGQAQFNNHVRPPMSRNPSTLQNSDHNSSPQPLPQQSHTEQQLNHQSPINGVEYNLQRERVDSAQSYITPPSTTFDPAVQYPMAGPLSAQLPLNTQQILQPYLDPNNPSTQMLMGGYPAAPFYSYNPNPSSKSSQSTSYHSGLNQTLAVGHSLTDPTHGEGSSMTNLACTPYSSAEGTPTQFTANFENPFDGNFGSGLETPGEWATYIDGSLWGEPTAPHGPTANS